MKKINKRTILYCKKCNIDLDGSSTDACPSHHMKNNHKIYWFFFNTLSEITSNISRKIYGVR